MSTSSTGQPPGAVQLTRAGHRAADLRPPAQRTDSPPLPAGLPERDLAALSLHELRTVRRDARRDEADLSYVRRLLQGRIDILRAELARRGPTAVVAVGEAAAATAAPAGPTAKVPRARSGGAEGSAGPSGAARSGGAPVSAGAPGSGRPAGAVGSVVEWLPGVLADAPARHRSSARHVTLSTPHGEEYRRLAAEMLSDVELSDLAARTDPELSEAMGRLVRYERHVSRRRQRMQRTADDCSAEIGRRYREGEAQVDDLLV
ncbi:aerial mycelium formation protein [Streptomyces actuosus]|uniref:Aerial mycelium formation protein n=1 Tax=Streptomyces actuosus TaxID=1885 RepID=A0ABS2VPX2_STRAS|nr:aerial mycelium formation protein [Streptomyces actuosus]MBN0045110.1 aerial mycelium formation protein [Streptomyces actuosus]